MKTKIEITNGATTITLLPENKFEERLIQDWYDEDKDSDVKVYKKNTSGWHNTLPNNQIEITLKDKVIQPPMSIDLVTCNKCGHETDASLAMCSFCAKTRI